jgi:hypothetical protein
MNPEKENDMTFTMFSDDALAKFRTFCSAAGFTKPPSPQGAFDQAMKPRKESTMSARYRYSPVPNTANTLFTRERANMAMDFEAWTDPNEMENSILQFLSGKISDDDMKQVRSYLGMEHESDAEEDDGGKMAGDRFPSGLRRRLDAAPATTSAHGGFDSRFPSAKRIGRDDGYSFR